MENTGVIDTSKKHEIDLKVKKNVCNNLIKHRKKNYIIDILKI